MRIMEKLTDEQLWQLCLLEEEKKKKIINDFCKENYKDKAVDWDYERFVWDKWNPRDLK
jgi:hypothetical protein